MISRGFSQSLLPQSQCSIHTGVFQSLDANPSHSELLCFLFPVSVQFTPTYFTGSHFGDRASSQPPFSLNDQGLGLSWLSLLECSMVPQMAPFFSIQVLSPWEISQRSQADGNQNIIFKTDRIDIGECGLCYLQTRGFWTLTPASNKAAHPATGCAVSEHTSMLAPGIFTVGAGAGWRAEQTCALCRQAGSPRKGEDVSGLCKPSFSFQM